MRKTNHYARSSALPAIAAALALSSTPLLAQEAQPVTEPVPQVTPPPPTMDTTPAPEASAPTADPVETSTEPTASTTTTVKRTARATTAKPADKSSAPVRTASTATAVRPAPTAPASTTDSSTQTQTSESTVPPVAGPVAPAPAAPTTAQANPAQQNNEEVPLIAGGALALLALGGGAFAIARRRRHEAEDDVWVDDQVVADDQVMAEEPIQAVEPVRDEPVVEPVYDEQPKIIAPATSAFSWGNTQARPMASASMDLPRQSSDVEQRSSNDDDRKPGESWVERAYRGPTPNNPSVSLRNRLKRAAFFDKREREVAAGTAQPVDMDAGLPEAMVEERERELA